MDQTATTGIAQAIEVIAKMNADKLKTQVLSVDAERKGVYFLVGPDGNAVKTLADPAWHVEKLDRPEELLAFVQKHAAERSAVFYRESGVVFVYDLADQRDRAFCDLIKSPQYEWVCKPGGPMRQADFVRLLRINLRGCLMDGSNLLPLVRKLRFNQTGEGSGDIQHGRESIGKSIQAQTSGESAIPEEVQLTIPVFENFGVRVPVMCAVELHVAEQMIQLTPYPLEARKAMDLTLDSIAELFKFDAETVQVYRGQPT